MTKAQGRVLIAAGSDSGGGAGIQADIKTVTALGGYAATAITALTAQNTLGVFGVQGVPADFIRQQIQAVLEDIGADAVKTGMLHDVPTIEAVAQSLEGLAAPIVVDPVMVAQSGAKLVQEQAVEALRQQMLPLATLLTPNIPEATVLTGIDIKGEAEMEAAGQQLLGQGAGAVLVKGGHMEGDLLIDLLVTPSGTRRFAGPRIDTQETHGTGCTLASAIATGLAQGLALEAAVDRARRYLRAALEAAPGFGQGQGPVGHGVTVRPFN